MKEMNTKREKVERAKRRTGHKPSIRQIIEVDSTRAKVHARPVVPLLCTTTMVDPLSAPVLALEVHISVTLFFNVFIIAKGHTASDQNIVD